MSALPETWLVHLIRMAEEDPDMILVRLAKEEEGVGISADFRYDKAQTPRLIEVHGVSTVTYYAETYAALKTAKIPVEFYLYPDAPHDLKSPLHRLHSLSRHTDWFRFWLQGYEDPAPEKQAQYARWRKMREDWEAAKAPAAPSKSRRP